MRVRPRAVVLAVVTVALTLLVLRVLESAGRVLGWVAMAAAIAAVLTPAVARLSERMPRGVAVAIVALGTLGAVAAVSYGLVEDVVQQLRVLQRAAPELAEDIERSGRFADAARDARLSERVRDIVAEVPERLRGGSTADAVRSATTRGLAFLAVAVLTIFMVLHGPRLLDGARRQIHDGERRALAERTTAAVEQRAIAYARGTGLIALLAGVFAFIVATAADVPGPAPLALWVALWDLVPLIGAVVGALPIVAMAAILSPAKGAVVAVAFIVWQVLEDLALQRPLERRTLRVGPFLTIAAGMAGLELYGLAGSLLAVLTVAVVLVAVEVAVAGERVPRTHGDE
jgi:predicted PurR-regulated permease PerM